ncbi:MAG: ribonuclease D [Gemmatimonadetes bacterium]|nr:ribonuclease D [Gemmatimonadota bacterium]
MNRPGHAHPLDYLDTAQDVEVFLDAIAGTRAIALDTEGASFHKYLDRIYLLQLSVDTRSAIIDPLPIGTPAKLGALLEDPKVEVVFHDADYDLRLLHQDYGWRVTNIFDTRIAAQLLGLTAFGLAALLERYFGLKLDKKHQRADWSMRPLTADMLDYAAQDTRHLLELRDLLRNELERKGRWAWAAEEFQRLEGTRWEPEDPGSAFLKMKGARDLTRRELARLKELVAWRDGIAKQLDRSTFRVMANEVLFEAARAGATTREQLAAIKGMPRGMLERQHAEILAAIAAGDAVAEADLPRFPKAAKWDKDPDFDAKVAKLKTVRDEAAKRLELDTGVLCARDRLEAVARRVPRTREELAEVKELRRWQAEEMGAEFIKALAEFAPRAAGDKAPAARATTPAAGATTPAAGGDGSPKASAASSAARVTSPSRPPSDSPYKDG